MSEKKTTTIQVSLDTHARLTKAGLKGESYDATLRRLLGWPPLEGKEKRR